MGTQDVQRQSSDKIGDLPGTMYPLWTMVDDLVQQGVTALRQNDVRAARRVFGQVVTLDPDHFVAWWYLASVIDDPVQKVHCLRQVLRLKPDHREAAQLLTRIGRQATPATPAKGMHRPVLDAEIAPDGETIVAREANWHTTTASEMPEGGASSDLSVTIVATLIALIAIVITATLYVSGIAFSELGARNPALEPTVRPITFDVTACIANGEGRSVLIFINNSGDTIRLYEGSAGSERLIEELVPDNQVSLDVQPGTPVRYSAHAESSDRSAGAAIIEVPPGNSCRVPIQ